MRDKQKYLEIRQKIIKPTMERLKTEYEAKGYKCQIGAIKPPDVTEGSRQGTRIIRSTYGAISLTVYDEDSSLGTVSIFLSDSGSVVVKEMDVIFGHKYNLDEITPEVVENEIRKVFG
ncbi:MAG TPA: hypothetical protein VNN20_06395 [Thermodesulfobacteriota bacterium]|nr:hypothetical protein [Thermodesulfobacteriota bacterium]